MPLISIRERGAASPGPVVSFDGQEHPIQVQDPFDEAAEAELEWYFEEHLRYPFKDEVRAAEAAESIRFYGEALFEQVFSDRRAYARYHAARSKGLETLAFEVAGSPGFHRLHWEALKDPDLKQPFALQAAFVRRNLQPTDIDAVLRESPTVNVLLVTARPGGRGDVGYRTIQRPLVETLRQAQLRVQVDILRPGTYEALTRRLEAVQEAHGPGYYHVIHFDVHGGLLTFDQFDQLEASQSAPSLTYQLPNRYGRPALAPYEGVKAFLFLERGAAGEYDPVEASELAGLLQVHGVPIVVLNACQSGKQVGARETSLGSQLMQAGVQMVLAMGYSVTVSAAERLMAEFYGQLFGGAALAAAIRSGRLELHNRKDRRAYYHYTIQLEDWLLPVVYENRPQTLKTREFTPEENVTYYAARAADYAAPQTTYGFVGRDLDVLEIERRLLGKSNILLLRGMGGAGKTTLLHHLGWWWQRTGFVEQVCYFGWDQRAWNRQQVMDAIARKLLSREVYERQFQPLNLDAQQALLAERLRATRHLLVLDNLESITGAELAIQHTLSKQQQAELHGFVQALAGGKTLVLLGSRGPEAWLAPGTFGDNVYPLAGLDPQAASELANLVLARCGAARYRGDADLERLIWLLDGYPLALEVVLPNLAQQPPKAVLDALLTGAGGIDAGGSAAGALDLAHPDIERRTQSILQCINYSHSNLDQDAQALLLCLAPFTGVIFLPTIEEYTEALQRQPALAGLPFDRWGEVLQQAVNWGLLAPHEARGYLRIQPTLPYFLRARLGGPEQAAVRAAVETAFREHYDDAAGALSEWMQSKAPQERQIGQALAGLEYENIFAALQLALRDRVLFFNLYVALSNYLDAMQDQRRGLELGASVLAALERWPAGELDGQMGLDYGTVIDDVALRQLLLKQYEAARRSYQRALELVGQVSDLPDAVRGKLRAATYHQLGRVAEEQRQWAPAEGYYRQALALKVEFADRYSQASTYHQLGYVAQEQRQWAPAEGYYQQALAIKVEFADRYSQASTYHGLGVVAQAQRQWAPAEGYYQKALALFVEFADRYNQAKTYHQLGMVAQAQRQWAQAEGYYQQALAIYVEFADRYEQAKTYHQLGRVAEEQRQWAPARAYYLTALEIFHAYQDEYNSGMALGSLARLWRAAQDDTLPAAVAALLGVAEAEARERLGEG